MQFCLSDENTQDIYIKNQTESNSKLVMYDNKDISGSFAIFFILCYCGPGPLQKKNSTQCRLFVEDPDIGDAWLQCIFLQVWMTKYLEISKILDTQYSASYMANTMADTVDTTWVLFHKQSVKLGEFTVYNARIGNGHYAWHASVNTAKYPFTWT